MRHDLDRLYPELHDKIRITLVDGYNKILSTYDEEVRLKSGRVCTYTKSWIIKYLLLIKITAVSHCLKDMEITLSTPLHLAGILWNILHHLWFACSSFLWYIHILWNFFRVIQYVLCAAFSNYFCFIFAKYFMKEIFYSILMNMIEHTIKLLSYKLQFLLSLHYLCLHYLCLHYLW